MNIASRLTITFIYMDPTWCCSTWSYQWESRPTKQCPKILHATTIQLTEDPSVSKKINLSPKASVKETESTSDQIKFKFGPASTLKSNPSISTSIQSKRCSTIQMKANPSTITIKRSQNAKSITITIQKQILQKVLNTLLYILYAFQKRAKSQTL